MHYLLHTVHNEALLNVRMKPRVFVEVLQFLRLYEFVTKAVAFSIMGISNLWAVSGPKVPG